MIMIKDRVREIRDRKAKELVYLPTVFFSPQPPLTFAFTLWSQYLLFSGQCTNHYGYKHKDLENRVSAHRKPIHRNRKEKLFTTAAIRESSVEEVGFVIVLNVEEDSDRYAHGKIPWEVSIV